MNVIIIKETLLALIKVDALHFYCRGRKIKTQSGPLDEKHLKKSLTVTAFASENLSSASFTSTDIKNYNRCISWSLTKY